MMAKQIISEDLCFICKDGGLLLECDDEDCYKAYHPECVGLDPSQLEKNDLWVCSHHSCFICHKTSKFKCFCCPNSLCRACLKDAEFVTVKEEKGFCNNCLSLALLIEDNRDEDSDGGKVDFSDKETYEFLFKEYWEMIKLNESLSPEDIQKANAFLKKRKKRGLSMDSDMEPLYSDKKCGRPNRTKKYLKRVPSRKKEFIGWGSKVLLNFLTSLGKEVDKPISQSVVYDIVMDYVRENKLDVGVRNSSKKKVGKGKKITCDDRLWPLFRRKVVNRFRISDYLEPHFVENQISEEEYFCGSDDESPSGTCKESNSKLKQNSSELKSFNEKALEIFRNSYASIVVENLKLLYLKRSLVVKLLKNPETLADKMVGSYVRVKPDPNDSKKTYQLMQVIGVDKVSEPYMVHGVTTEVVLRVLHAADTVKVIPISMISEDDLLQEECENLRQKMNDGLLERPRVGLVEEKARSLHEDITNHWIERELVRLDNLIDRANERGWRRMFYEHMGSKELLESEAERSMLLKELPKVIPDTKVDCHGASCQSENAEGVNEGIGNPSDKMVEGEDEGTGVFSIQTRQRGRPKGEKAQPNENVAPTEENGQGLEISVRPLELSSANLPDGQEQFPDAWISPNSAENVAVDHQAGRTAGHEENSQRVEISVRLSELLSTNLPARQEQFPDAWISPNSAGNVAVDHQAGGTAGHEEPGQPSKKYEANVIDLDDSDEEETAEQKKQTSVLPVNQWLYKDPKGVTRGPFPLSFLRAWSKQGFFESSFKVWQWGQDPNDAVLLTVVLRSAFPDA